MAGWCAKMKAPAHGDDPGSPRLLSRRGGAVYRNVLDLDTLLGEGAALPNVQTALLAGWVAFALQVLGDEVLDADAAIDPSTAHFVPEVTAEQAMALGL